jgi:hypothetical protein
MWKRKDPTPDSGPRSCGSQPRRSHHHLSTQHRMGPTGKGTQKVPANFATPYFEMSVFKLSGGFPEPASFSPVS